MSDKSRMDSAVRLAACGGSVPAGKSVVPLPAGALISPAMAAVIAP